MLARHQRGFILPVLHRRGEVSKLDGIDLPLGLDDWKISADPLLIPWRDSDRERKRDCGFLAQVCANLGEDVLAVAFHYAGSGSLDDIGPHVGPLFGSKSHDIQWG